jgi:hypothetical protein
MDPVTLCTSCGLPLEPFALECRHCHPEPPIEEAKPTSGYNLPSASLFLNVLILLLSIFNVFISLAIIFVIVLVITFVIFFLIELSKLVPDMTA